MTGGIAPTGLSVEKADKLLHLLDDRKEAIGDYQKVQDAENAISSFLVEIDNAGKQGATTKRRRWTSEEEVTINLHGYGAGYIADGLFEQYKGILFGPNARELIKPEFLEEVRQAISEVGSSDPFGGARNKADAYVTILQLASMLSGQTAVQESIHSAMAEIEEKSDRSFFNRWLPTGQGEWLKHNPHPAQYRFGEILFRHPEWITEAADRIVKETTEEERNQMLPRILAV